MKLHSDAIVGAAWITFCVGAFVVTTTFRDVPEILSQNVPPTFFPRLVLGVIASLSSALVLTSFRRRRDSMPKVRKTVFVSAAIFTVAVALIPYLGMLLTVLLVTIALPLYWGERSARRIATLAVLLPVAIYIVFGLGLGMRFPSGVLW